MRGAADLGTSTTSQQPAYKGRDNGSLRTEEAQVIKVRQRGKEERRRYRWVKRERKREGGGREK